MKFIMDKWKVLYLRQNNQMHKYKLGNYKPGYRTTEKDTGVMVDRTLNELTESYHCKMSQLLYMFVLTEV